jgi:nitric oxide reductase subunit B
VLLDLLPAGILQLAETLEHGLWRARSQAWLSGPEFQTLTWLRIVGGALFLLGGVVPLAWFLVSRGRRLRGAAAAAMQLPRLAPPETVTAQARPAP